MRSRLATRSLRSRLAWSASAVIALWLVGLTVGADVLLGRVLAGEADGVLQARAEATAATVRVAADGRVAVATGQDDAALDVGTWIFAADGAVVEQPSTEPGGLARTAATLVDRGERTTETGLSDRIRLLALPVRQHGAQVATVVTSTSLAPYRQVERLAWAGSGLLGLGLLVVVHLALRLNVARALRPVQQMTAQAGRWSADDVARRFGAAARPVELAELARTLDGVLDRLAAVLRRERQLSDELSHELRTPLARITAEIDLLRDRPRSAAERDRAYAAVDDAARSMTEIVETLMTSARTAAGATSGRSAALAVLGPVVSRAAAVRPSLRADVDIDPDLVVGVDRTLLERLVSPVVENAVRHARQVVGVAATAGPGGARLLVTDDGPGVPPDQRESVFEAGWRGDAGDGHDGAGLGLALARRLAEAAGGSVHVDGDGPRNGARFVIDLPGG